MRPPPFIGLVVSLLYPLFLTCSCSRSWSSCSWRQFLVCWTGYLQRAYRPTIRYLSSLHCALWCCVVFPYATGDSSGEAAVWGLCSNDLQCLACDWRYCARGSCPLSQLNDQLAEVAPSASSSHQTCSWSCSRQGFAQLQRYGQILSLIRSLKMVTYYALPSVSHSTTKGHVLTNCYRYRAMEKMHWPCHYSSKPWPWSARASLMHHHLGSPSASSNLAYLGYRSTPAQTCLSLTFHYYLSAWRLFI